MDGPNRPGPGASLGVWCAFWRAMDNHFGTMPASPLHHDNRCGIHGPPPFRRKED